MHRALLSSRRGFEVDRPVRLRYPILGLALCVTTTGCTASGSPNGASTSLDLTLRPITSCPAKVRVPRDVSIVDPSAKNPPTSVLRTGDALAFTAAAGSRVGAVGTSDRPQDNVICQAVRGTGANRLAVIVGRSPGFIQVALRTPGNASVKRTLVTVTN